MAVESHPVPPTSPDSGEIVTERHASKMMEDRHYRRVRQLYGTPWSSHLSIKFELISLKSPTFVGNVVMRRHFLLVVQDSPIV
jgi:hypothetical protein